MKKHFILLAFLLPMLAHAQKMTVESMRPAESDMTATLEENLHKDLDGNYGGLVKVFLAASGAQFLGPSVFEAKAVAISEYWVFMAKGAFKLQVSVPGKLPLPINFRDWGIEGIESRRTYVLTITVPQAGVVQEDDGNRYFAINVEPKNSTVFVDDSLQQVDENGDMSVYVPMGRHTYKVMANGYASQEGTIDVTDKMEPMIVRLVSTQATLRVECDTKGAIVFVNGQQKGVAPWSGSLSNGSYQVEARLDGYRPQKQSVTLVQKESRTLKLPTLQMIAGRINVDCRPVGSEVYIDGKKVGTSPGVFRDIQVGNRSVEIRKEGYETLKKTVAVKENEQASLTGTLTALANTASTSQTSSGSSITAQEMTVKSMRLDPIDTTANLSENLIQDNNGDYAGLVKVNFAAANAEFEGQVLKSTPHGAGEYWVFMAKGSYKLKVRASGYLPLDINFRYYGIDGIESRRTYVLTILTPQTVNDVSNSTSTSSSVSNGVSTSTSDKETFTVNGVSFTMVRVEGGTFMMGATEEQGSEVDDDEKPSHEVTLSTFSIGETEVTQALWQAVMGSNPSNFNDNPQNPVERVSWEDCKEFIKKLNSLTGKTFRLPTEAEWEYAARGGGKSKHYKYSGGNKIKDVAWFGDNSKYKTHPVKGKSPNELGLYDISGNVWEWCEDWYGEEYYKSSPKSNPKGPATGSNRVVRGGCWFGDALDCRVSNRDEIPIGHRGLRLAL